MRRKSPALRLPFFLFAAFHRSQNFPQNLLCVPNQGQVNRYAFIHLCRINFNMNDFRFRRIFLLISNRAVTEPRPNSYQQIRLGNRLC